MSTGLAAYTLFHVVISLIGIGSGLVVVAGLVRRRRLDQWTVIFLVTTAATSLTGFGFPVSGFLPSHAIGILSVAVLAVAAVARYPKHLAGAWRMAYAIAAVVALYFNVFVLVVQLFRRVPALSALAPTQSEPPFAIVQGVVLALFVALGVAAAKRFREGERRVSDGRTVHL
jgi:hypothetical protein